MEIILARLKAVAYSALFVTSKFAFGEFFGSMITYFLVRLQRETHFIPIISNDQKLKTI